MPLAVPNVTIADRVKAYRDHLFERWVEAKRQAASSDDIADHRAVADAYTAFMRAHLADDERTFLDLEDEIARLTIENTRLREQRTIPPATPSPRA